MKLVVVESPAKAKTIEKYLGKEYKVKSSKGHIVDLPKSGLAVDVQHKFKPEYAVTKPAVVKELKQALKGAHTLVLAVDPDREGEAIGWHVAQVLGLINPDGSRKHKSIDLERIVFTEITKDAVQAAAANPRKIDMDLVHAQQTRRILDRLVGYKLSPLLWKKIRFGLSAGRVQSVAVRLIVEREAERDAFVPDEYWSVIAALADKKSAVKIELKLRENNTEEEDETDDLPLFKLTKLGGKKPELTTKAAVEKLLNKIQDEKWQVIDIKQEINKKNPSAPFTTSTMQQFAANVFGFSAVRTMKAAQRLYESGLITYMRTDSTNLSQQAIDAARKYIQSKYGPNYMPAEANYYRTKSKVAQEAHEAIRPTDFSKSASDLGLTGDESRLYTAIRNRALSSQMSPAELEVKTVTVQVGEAEFVANERKLKFKGYLQVSDDRVTEVSLPKASVGQQLYPANLTGDQHFTQPPPRFSEATLIKELEKQGIGRPSTYAPIIQTIQARGYVEKSGKYFIPTDTGKVVTQLLVKYFDEIVDLGFTAGMEDKLDEIADGKLKWVDMLEEFYAPFEKTLIKREKSIDRDEFTVLGKSDQKCPECGKPMVIKLGRYGRFISCSNFPECKGMLPWVGEGSDGKEINDVDFLKQYEPAPKTDDGRDYVLKAGRFGQFWAHPDYPKVKDAKPLVMKREVLVEKFGDIPQTTDKRDYVIRKGRFGEFWAHPDYPKVKDIIRVKKPKAKNSEE